MISDQVLGSIIGGIGGATAAILIALVVVIRYLDRRDQRNRESFEALARIYAAMLADLIASDERTVERLINTGPRADDG